MALPSAPPPNDELDALLSAQIAVAWAGEGGDEPRLGWWRTTLASEYGGEDLFKRLLPSTWDWAVLQALREAARRHDARLRDRAHDPDTIVSLFRLGFTIDERADERLLELKRSGESPATAFPAYAELMKESWRSETFERFAATDKTVAYQKAPAGRQLKGGPDLDLRVTTRKLVGALLPLSDAYPLPHFRV